MSMEELTRDYQPPFNPTIHSPVSNTNDHSDLMPVTMPIEPQETLATKHLIGKDSGTNLGMRLLDTIKRLPISTAIKDSSGAPEVVLSQPFSIAKPQALKRPVNNQLFQDQLPTNKVEQLSDGNGANESMEALCSDSKAVIEDRVTHDGDDILLTPYSQQNQAKPTNNVPYLLSAKDGSSSDHPIDQVLTSTEMAEKTSISTTPLAVLSHQNIQSEASVEPIKENERGLHVSQSVGAPSPRTVKPCTWSLNQKETNEDDFEDPEWFCNETIEIQQRVQELEKRHLSSSDHQVPEREESPDAKESAEKPRTTQSRTAAFFLSKNSTSDATQGRSPGDPLFESGQVPTTQQIVVQDSNGDQCVPEHVVPGENDMLEFQSLVHLTGKQTSIEYIAMKPRETVANKVIVSAVDKEVNNEHIQPEKIQVKKRPRRRLRLGLSKKARVKPLLPQICSKP